MVNARSEEETLALRKAHEEEIRAMEAAIADMQRSWEEKLAEAQARVPKQTAGTKHTPGRIKKVQQPEIHSCGRAVLYRRFVQTARLAIP